MRLGWELFWFMVVLKIPVVYLACVVWWALRPSRPLEPAIRVAAHEPALGPRGGRTLRTRPRRPRGGPHESPRRTTARRVRAAAAERR